MRRRRDPSFTLAEAVRDRGFWPRAGDVPGLLTLLDAGDEELAVSSSRALARVDAPIAEAIEPRFDELGPSARALVCRALGARVAERREAAPARELLARGLADAHPKVRRAAVSSFGKLRDDEARSSLVPMLDTEQEPTVRRELVRALGALGAREELERLTLAPDQGALDWAKLVAARSGEREAASVDLSVALDFPLEVALSCRSGLEAVLEGELAALGFEASGHPRSGRVKVELARGRRLSELAEARTAIGLSIVARRRRRSESDAELVVACLSAPEVESLVRRLTRGEPRFRLEWLGAGKRRALTREVATEMARRGSALVNDPTESVWQARVALGEAGLRVDLVPRYDDARFAYRVADVPAASHPTLAAALVRVAGVVPGEIVWDPFVGSGLELCERARLGDYARLVGHDLDPSALTRARANLSALGTARFELVEGDARQASVPGVGLVLSNPPMGRRVRGDDAVEDLLGAVIARAAAQLAPGGRVVLASPRPRDTRLAAQRAALELSASHRVDMGGFDAEIQRFDRR